MEVKQLLFFKRAAELEHMTQAAKDLQVSQPFLSKTIAELEDELGVKLFDHVGRGIVLNEYGRAYYRHVVKMVNEAEDAQAELRDMLEQQKSEILIATNVGLYMPALFKQMTIAEPRLTMRLHSARRKRIIRMLQEGLVDYAVCVPQIEEPGLETKVLMREQGAIIYPPGHWLKDYKEIRLKDLVNETFISVAPGYGTRDAAEDYFRQVGVYPSVGVETTDTSSIFNFVNNGLGIAIAALTLVKNNPDFANQYAILTDPPLYAEVGLTRASGRYLSENCRTFSHISIDYFRQLGAEK